jgi:hypothetical protein
MFLHRPIIRSGVLVVLTLATSIVALPAIDSSGSTTPSSWTVAATPSPTGSWNTVDYANGTWVALGRDANVAVSTDGATWTEYPVPSGSWQTVAYGGGQFLALSSFASGSREMVSTNGTSWTSQTGPVGYWTGLAYGQGHFVAVGANGQIATSSNGTTWTTTFSRRFDEFSGVAYGNGRFIAVDARQGDTLLSTDGVHWAFFPASTSGISWGAVAYGNGNFVALDRGDAGEVGTTVLGSIWSLSQFSPAQPIDTVAYGCGNFVAGGAPASSGNNFLSSPMGSTWTSVPVPADESSTWTSMAYGAGNFVAVDNSGSIASLAASGNCAQITPTSPQQVSGNIHNQEVWTYMHPPTSQGSSPVLRYLVTISNGTTTKTCNAVVYFEPNCIIKGLQNRAVYHVTAQALNKYGYSVPTDPLFVIPVSSAALSAWAAPSETASSPITVELTGVIANSLGIYPVAVVTVHVGTKIVTCIPSPFGQCLLNVANPGTKTVAISASYTGYGHTYHSKTITVTNK